MSDIERATITILSQATIDHPILRAWITELVQDGGAQTDLNTYAASSAAVLPQPNGDTVSIAALGYATEWPDGLRAAIMDGTAYPAGEADDDTRETLRRERAIARDRLIVSLAGELVAFRRGGRVEGDRSFALGHGNLAIATVTTSLAAAVAEYVTGLENIWADSLAAVL